MISGSFKYTNKIKFMYKSSINEKCLSINNIKTLPILHDFLLDDF